MSAKTGNHRVSLIRDNLMTFPEMWMEIFVAGDMSEQRAFASMFIKSKCTRALKPEEADIVVFTGGEDVNPIFYDENPHPLTSYNTARDEQDIELYAKCLELGIPMFGVCRGAQFLHVMNGGKLYQHVNNHTGDHSMYDVREKRVLPRVSSVHHQMVIRNNDMMVLGESSKANERWKNDKEVIKGNICDVEAFFYRDTYCLGVQGHPEYAGYNQFMQWTLERIDELIVNSPDIVTEGRYRRLDPSIRALRDAKYKEMLEDKQKELN